MRVKSAGGVCLLVSFLLSYNNSVLAQSCNNNLVPNPSFEDYDLCPDMESQFDRVSVWTRFKGGAEYYNACDISNYVGVPYNIAGYQQAAIGQAYAGVNTYGFRDYIGVQLLSSLVIGVRYYVNFKVSPTLIGTLPFGSDKYVSNKIGALFRTTSTTQLPTSNFAHVYTDSIISDTTVWTSVHGSFIADSAYQYIVLGNFFHDSLTAFININPLGMWNLAYYYIDDVCVSTDSFECFSTILVCDDGDLCTMDTCLNGQCSHLVIVCDDNNACTINNCNSINGCVYATLSCNDSNICTIDACDSVTGCSYILVSCDDSNTCTEDVCDSLDGCVHSSLNCEDGNVCTIDACDSLDGCVYLAVNCDDNKICTKDICDSLTGCFYPALNCEDGNVCTIDLCDSILECIYAPVICDDSDSCTVNVCDSINGCIYIPILSCINGVASTQDELPSVYPNPTSGLVMIEFPSLLTSVCVYNHLGQLVASFDEIKDQKVVTLNLSIQPSGIYLLTTKTRNSFSIHKIFLTY